MIGAIYETIVQNDEFASRSFVGRFPKTAAQWRILAEKGAKTPLFCGFSAAFFEKILCYFDQTCGQNDERHFSAL